MSISRFPAQRQVRCPKSFQENECLRLANDAFFCFSRGQIHKVLEVTFSADISALNSMFGAARNFFFLATPEASLPTVEGLCKGIENEVMVNVMTLPKE